MPAPGTDKGLPCASLEPWMAGGDGLSLIPSELIEQPARTATQQNESSGFIA